MWFPHIEFSTDGCVDLDHRTKNRDRDTYLYFQFIEKKVVYLGFSFSAKI